MGDQPLTNLDFFDGGPGAGACFRSDQPAVAQNIMSERYKSHHLTCLAGDLDFDFFHVGAEVPVGSFNVLRYGSHVEIDPGAFKDFFMLEMPVAGGARVQQGGMHLGSSYDTALFLSPDQRIHSVWARGTTQLMLKIKRSELITRWQQRLDNPVAELPEVSPEIDLNRPAGWRIRRLMHLLYEELERSLRLDNGSVAQTPLAAAVIDNVFEYWADVHGHLLEGPAFRILPVHIKRSVAYIEDHLSKDLRVSTLARVGNVSERTIYDGFLKFLKRSPKQYVLERRLNRARQDLISGKGSVAGVARKYGINHLGRFSQYYRIRYGENPSETLLQRQRRLVS
ncbi:AraC family transcriptional regulator [Nitratireductor sp. XY-223]|uniref:AraC family transcriptional regulator n=1 Tax=Nitratireductor sp. XY-223 TaxID=2561926 RepID=UPI00145B6C7D|nr:AraC family transcriptional regulator [Nitratireductor sp. XY-223]